MSKSSKQIIPNSGRLLIKDSLVKYNDPVLIYPSQETNKEFACDSKVENYNMNEESSSLQQILDCIVPPIEWEENGFLWRQTVSREPATREDVVILCKQLDMSLQQQNARSRDICPIRRRLMNQCFNEIIRQVTVDCSDRGLLLLRVRDEMKKSLDAYETLFHSSMVYSIQKAIEAEQRLLDTTQRIAQEKELKYKYEKELSEVYGAFKQVERDLKSKSYLEQMRNNEEIESLKRSNKQLKAQYEGIVVVKE